jgi:bla regulator protein blaR1
MLTALLDHLWQSTLCTLAAALVTLALRRNEARVRFWVWLAAAAKFLIPFSLLSALGSHFSEQRAQQAALAGQGLVNVVQQIVEPLTAPGTATSHAATTSSIATVLLVLWGIGCAMLLVRWGVRWMKIRATLANAVPAPIAAPVHLNKRIPVKLTAELWEPAVVGLFRPVLLLPSGIGDRLTSAQLQSVIAHEVCHVRRHDNLTAAVQMLVEAIFWFHPLVWWIGARMVEERERACDEGVLAMWNQPEVYAEGILRVCRFYVESRLACVAGVSGADLKKRVEIIMTQRTVLRLNAARKMLLATATAIAIAGPVVTGLLGTRSVAAQETASQPASQPGSQPGSQPASQSGSQRVAQTAPQAAATADAAAANAVFDSVAIVKSAGRGIQWLVLKDDGLTAQGTSLRTVIQSAYGVSRSRVIGGPDWIDAPLYDIVARSSSFGSGGIPSSAFGPMIRKLLASRFGLVAHPDTQQLSVYALSVDEKGAKLKDAASNSSGSASSQARRGFRMGPGQLVATDVDIKMVTGLIDRQLGRPVLDRTGLTGHYDFTLTGPLTADSLPATLHDQLGLNIEPATLPMDVIVVDQLQEPTLDPPEAFTRLGGGVPPFPVPKS